MVLGVFCTPSGSGLRNSSNTNQKPISKHANNYEACLNFVINSNVDKIILGINDKNHITKILNFRKINSKIPVFKFKKTKLIDPIYWLKFNK